MFNLCNFMVYAAKGTELKSLKRSDGCLNKDLILGRFIKHCQVLNRRNGMH